MRDGSKVLMSSKKNNIFSIMKGLAITGVVAGHIGFEKLDIFVNYWHLPTFFFVSGYFLKEKYIINGKEFLVSRLKRLLLPFILYAVIALLLHNSLINLGVIGGCRYVESDYWMEIRRILFLSSNEELIGAMWFLPALFLVTCISWCLLKLQTFCDMANYKIGGGIFMIIGLLAIHYKVPSPYSIFQYMTIAWIYLFGYMVRTENLDDKLRKRLYVLISIVILLVALFTDSHFGCQVSAINHMQCWFPLVFIAGIIVINYISYCINGCRIGRLMAFIGDYSFSIMALHFVAFKLVTYLHHLIDNSVFVLDFPTSLTNIYIWAPVYLVAGITLPILASKFYDKLKNVWCNNCRIQESGTNG